MRLNVSATNFKEDQNFSRAYNGINIIELTLFMIKLLCWEERKTVMKLRSTKLHQSTIVLDLELLLDITFLLDPSQHALLKQLKDHVDINNKLRRTDRNGKVEKR